MFQEFFVNDDRINGWIFSPSFFFNGGIPWGHNLVILSFDPITSWHPSWPTLNRGGWWCFDVTHKLEGHEVGYLIFLGKNQGWCKMSGVFFLGVCLGISAFCWLLSSAAFGNNPGVLQRSGWGGCQWFSIFWAPHIFHSLLLDVTWHLQKEISLSGMQSTKNYPLLLGGFRCRKTSFGKTTYQGCKDFVTSLRISDISSRFGWSHLTVKRSRHPQNAWEIWTFNFQQDKSGVE